ncbi:MAG: hypothetical protein HY736_23355 [Verrucomicrobia bacterium]|nr:hypothetical protein [Verrucomicrobiota bacterium]
MPCHIRELGTKALRGIVRELKSVPCLKQIGVGIDGTSRAREWRRAKHFFQQLRQKPVLLWNDGPRMTALFKKLEEAEIGPGAGGKGAQCVDLPWLSTCQRAGAHGGHARLRHRHRQLSGRGHVAILRHGCRAQWPYLSAARRGDGGVDVRAGIRTAAKAFQEDPLWSPLISNWNRVESALPNFLDELREAVRLDND